MTDEKTENVQVVASIGDWSKIKKEKMRSFDDLLDDIEYADTKQKTLWREIYSNAIEDRRNALSCFVSLFPKVATGDLSDHAMAGKDLSSYLTRMEKSNTQLLKLSELIQEVKKREEQFNADNLFKEVGEL